jgi:hypothetical protein
MQKNKQTKIIVNDNYKQILGLQNKNIINIVVIIQLN